MNREVLYAVGKFEIGDTFLDEEDQMHLITDVLVCHYVKNGIYRVLYEVDASGEFIELHPYVKEQPVIRQNKPILHLTGQKKKPKRHFLNTGEDP